MIVPQFWAEGRLQRREKGRQVTVRRFGWSDSSAAEAQAHADVRVKEALERLLAGEKLPRREPKIPYNGAAGVPIREEIVSRHGATIITRNSYGARCLNTPNVFFADIDFAQEASLRFKFGVFAALVLCAAAIAWATHSRATGVTLSILAILFASSISGAVYRRVQKAQGGAEHAARNRIRRFLDKHPEWNLRLYKTPAGMRVLATHRPFSPSEPAVAECFDALDADPVYATMCLNQQCFRARVSAKPWRIGVQGHLRPRPGVWPIAPERLPIRNAWIAEYEEAASVYSACSFLESIGSGTVHPATQSVQELHDELCSATSKLPIA
jgi:hypothetical protein